jgi:hypothetical protein
MEMSSDIYFVIGANLAIVALWYCLFRLRYEGNPEIPPIKSRPQIEKRFVELQQRWFKCVGTVPVGMEHKQRPEFRAVLEEAQLLAALAELQWVLSPPEK